MLNLNAFERTACAQDFLQTVSQHANGSSWSRLHSGTPRPNSSVPGGCPRLLSRRWFRVSIARPPGTGAEDA